MTTHRLPVFIAWLLFILCTGFGGLALADDHRSVYGPTPPSSFTLFAFDPDLLGGWNTPLRAYEKKYIPEKYRSLPVLGGWYGEGYIPDQEVLLGSGLKKAFYLGVGFHDKLQLIPILEKLGMEVVTAPGDLTRTPECFRAMGRAFNREERGETLGAYAEQVLSKVDNTVGRLPESRKPTIYFAMQADGLATVCRSSERAEALEMAGARNVHECLPGTEDAPVHITFEQLMVYDPEVILIFSPNLFKSLADKKNWQQLQAVKTGRVYLVPRGPFSWLERPATYMRLLGIQWLAEILHPDVYLVDIQQETKTFMKLFFNLDLNDDQVNDLLKS